MTNASSGTPGRAPGQQGGPDTSVRLRSDGKEGSVRSTRTVGTWMRPRWRTLRYLPVLLIAGTLIAGMAASPCLTLGGLLGVVLSGTGVYAVGRWLDGAGEPSFLGSANTDNNPDKVSE